MGKITQLKRAPKKVVKPLATRSSWLGSVGVSGVGSAVGGLVIWARSAGNWGSAALGVAGFGVVAGEGVGGAGSGLLAQAGASGCFGCESLSISPSIRCLTGAHKRLIELIWGFTG